MTTKDNGGPAFPVQSLDSEYRNGLYHDVWRPVGGMSLRDYFAAQVIQGGAFWPMNRAPSDGDTKDKYAAEMAREAYRVADSMLKARKA